MSKISRGGISPRIVRLSPDLSALSALSSQSSCFETVQGEAEPVPQWVNGLRPGIPASPRRRDRRRASRATTSDEEAENSRTAADVAPMNRDCLSAMRKDLFLPDVRPYSRARDVLRIFEAEELARGSREIKAGSAKTCIYASRRFVIEKPRRILN